MGTNYLFGRKGEPAKARKATFAGFTKKLTHVWRYSLNGIISLTLT